VIDFWLNGIEHLIDRITGPLHFRMLLQPLMALIYGVVDGLKDARIGKPPYFWALFSNPTHRREIVKDGWKSIGKVFLLALILDVGYQVAVLHFVYPGEAIIVATALAILPYLFIRGPVTRIARGLGVTRK
jgi:hypothetical protein